MSLDTDPNVATPAPDATAVTDASTASVAELAKHDVPPEIIAQSLSDYGRAWWARIRAGESGLLPVIFGLVIISVLFQIVSPSHVFFSAENLVNLFQQSAVFMVLAMAEGFALLLGEIDLSIGWMMAFGGVIAVQLVEPVTVKAPWGIAVIVALIGCAIAGAIQGTLISRLRLPSFIVTLAGFLILNGVVLILLLLGPFSGYPSIIGSNGNLKAIHNFMWGNIDPGISWIAMVAVVAVVGGLIFLRESGRRRHGLVAPPLSLTLIKVGVIAIVGVIVVWICDQNRAHFGTLEGVPFFIPIVLGILAVWTLLLQRTRYGRYVYAIGGNPEAARRAGVNLARIRTIAFALCAATAGGAGLLYLSLLDGMSNNVPGGQYVLYAVAAAVIGGTSLFGGRGKVIHGVIGGLVIGAIANGMGLLGLDVQVQFIVTGLVLLVAVTIDAVSRRAATSGSAARA